MMDYQSIIDQMSTPSQEQLDEINVRLDAMPGVRENLARLSTPKSQALLGNKNIQGSIVKDSVAQEVNDILGVEGPIDSYTNLVTGEGSSGSSFLDSTLVATQADEYLETIGKPMVRDDGKVYSFGNDAINQAVYGGNPNVQMSALSGRGEGYVTPQKTGIGPIEAGLGLMSLIAGPAALGAISGALPGAATAATGTTAATAATALNTGLSSGLLSAGTSAAGQLLSTGNVDVNDIAADLLTGGVIGAIPVVGDMYQADNFGGAFIRNTTNDVVSQQLRTGELDINDALKSGLIGMGVETVGDIIGDARQTNDGNLTAGVNQVNGRNMSVQDVNRLTNTTDVFGLLGENGFLGQLGINTGSATNPLFNTNGYLSTDWLGNGLDFLDTATNNIFNFGGNPIFQNELNNQRVRDYRDGVDTSNSAAMADAFARANDRYDERFFDLFTKRGDGAGLTGIYEANPIGTDGFAGFGAVRDSFGGEQVNDGGFQAANFAPEGAQNATTLSTLPSVTGGGFESVIIEELKSDTTNNTPITDDLFGDNELMGTNLPELQAPVDDLPANTPNPSELQAPTQTQGVPSDELAGSPSSGGSGGGGGSGGFGDPFGEPFGDITDELFRLARVMEINPESVEAQEQLKKIVAGGALDNVKGDITVDVDPKSGRYIVRKKDPEDEDPIASALENIA